MDENITIQEEEKLAMQLMESFDNPSDEDIASLDVNGCAPMCKDLMDIEMAMKSGEHLVDAKEMLQAFHAKKRKASIRRMVIGWSAVAAILAGVFFFLFDSGEEVKTAIPLAKVEYIYKANEPIYNKVEEKQEKTAQGNVCIVATRQAETKSLVLPDGTEVTLNSGSRLTYPTHFGGDKRIVKLYGEAFFKVKKDRRHPFVVESGKLNTTVLGTQFDVKNYGAGAPVVLLVEGKVMLSDSLGKSNVVMKPGQRATLNEQGDISLTDHVDTENYLSWKDGYQYYDNISLYEMMNELGRWYHVDVICKNASAMSNRVHFYVPNQQPLEKTVEMINKMDIAHVTLEGKQLVVR